MENIVYVTSNKGKYESVKRKFNSLDLPIDFMMADLEEPLINDIEFISREKVKEAYGMVGRPCFVADSGFYIKNYPGNPGYPGAFVKRSGISTNIDNLLITLKDVDDREACFLDCLTFYDGNEYYTFFGRTNGIITKEKRGEHMQIAKSNLWYVFVPQGSNKTLAEMTDEERDKPCYEATSATLEFALWYKNEYMKQMKLKR